MQSYCCCCNSSKTKQKEKKKKKKKKKNILLSKKLINIDNSKKGKKTNYDFLFYLPTSISSRHYHGALSTSEKPFKK